MLYGSVVFEVFAYVVAPDMNPFDESNALSDIRKPSNWDIYAEAFLLHLALESILRCWLWQVSDHFTPAYLASMASAVACFEAGYPAKRLQHVELSSDEAAAGDGVTAYGDDASADEVAYGHAKAA